MIFSLFSKIKFEELLVISSFIVFFFFLGCNEIYKFSFLIVERHQQREDFRALMDNKYIESLSRHFSPIVLRPYILEFLMKPNSIEKCIGRRKVNNKF